MRLSCSLRRLCRGPASQGPRRARLVLEALEARDVPTAGITEFSTGLAANSSPYQIAAGPDDNLWFTDLGGDRVGRITPGSTISEFPVNGSPQEITAGADGNLWFTEYEGSSIGRMTTRGQLTEFAVANKPTAITAGPDGNVWFAEF